MRRLKVSTICSLLMLFATTCALSVESARAQSEGAVKAPTPEVGAAAEAEMPKRVAAELIDSYGKVGHCDLTARLDNLAIILQNEPATKGYVIGYDLPDKRQGIADWNVRTARFYLINSRGIDASRIVAFRGGQKSDEEALTELWVVPEGAAPPVAAPSGNKYEDASFSGKFDSYVADEQIYREQVDMGTPSADIAYTEFAEKLKQQAESVGYIVVRPSKSSAPGAWRRIGRRDEQILSRSFNVEAQRLKTINGGTSGDDETLVEFWILPKSALPPPGDTMHAEHRARDAYRVNTYETYYEQADEAENWMLENLADALRENPRASAALVVREPAPGEVIGSEASDAPVSDEKDASANPQQFSPIAESEDGASAADGSAEEAEEAGASMKDTAERWKRLLEARYGIAAHRIRILEGAPMKWSIGRLSTWVVPHKAKWPDPFARDKDEIEAEEIEREAREGVETATAPQPPPPLR